MLYRKPKYAVVYEDPDDDRTGVHVLHPSPRWLQEEAMAGLLPPVSVFWDLQQEEDRQFAEGKDVIIQPRHLWIKQFTAERIGPLTEEQAMEYLILKDVPRSVWSRRHNRPMVKIISQEDVPTQFEFIFAEAWEMVV